MTALPGHLSESRSSRALAAMVGGAAVIVGSLLPWASVTTAFGSISVNGTEGDGILTLIAGTILAIAGVIKHGAEGRAAAANMLIVLAAIAAGLIAAYDISNISAVGDNPFASSSVGAGLYFVLLGAVVGLIGASGGGGRAAPVLRPCPFCKEVTPEVNASCYRCGRIISGVSIAPAPPEV